MKVNIQTLIYNKIIPQFRYYNFDTSQITICAPRVFEFLRPYILACYYKGVHLIYEGTDEYEFNSARAAGSLPVDQVCQSVVVKKVKDNPWDMELCIDDTLVPTWRTRDGELIYKYHSNARGSGRIVRNFTDHWRCPINGVHEVDIIEERAQIEIMNLLEESYIQQKVISICYDVLKAQYYHQSHTMKGKK